MTLISGVKQYRYPRSNGIWLYIVPIRSPGRRGVPDVYHLDDPDAYDRWCAATISRVPSPSLDTRQVPGRHKAETRRGTP